MLKRGSRPIPLRPASRSRGHCREQGLEPGFLCEFNQLLEVADLALHCHEHLFFILGCHCYLPANSFPVRIYTVTIPLSIALRSRNYYECGSILHRRRTPLDDINNASDQIHRPLRRWPPRHQCSARALPAAPRPRSPPRRRSQIPPTCRRQWSSG